MGFSSLLHPDSLLGAHTWSSKNGGSNYTSKAPPPSASDPYLDELHKIVQDYRKTANVDWETAVSSGRTSSQKPALTRSLSTADDVSARSQLYSDWMSSKEHLAPPPPPQGPPSVRFDEDVRYMDEQVHDHEHHFSQARAPGPPVPRPPPSQMMPVPYQRHNHLHESSMSHEFDTLLDHYLISEDTLARAYEEIEHLKGEYRLSSRRCQKLLDQLSGCKSENHMLRREAIAASDNSHDLILDINRLRDSLDRYRRRIHELEEFVRTRNTHPPRGTVDQMHISTRQNHHRRPSTHQHISRELHDLHDPRDPRHRDPRELRAADPRNPRREMQRERELRELRAFRDREQHSMLHRTEHMEDPRRRAVSAQHPPTADPYGRNRYASRSQPDLRQDMRHLNMPEPPPPRQLRRTENFDLSRTHPSATAGAAAQSRRRRASFSAPMTDREMHPVPHHQPHPPGPRPPLAGVAGSERREPGPRKRRMSDFLANFGSRDNHRPAMASRSMAADRAPLPQPHIPRDFHTTTSATRHQGPHSSSLGSVHAHPERQQSLRTQGRKVGGPNEMGVSGENHAGYHDSEIENLEQLLRSSAPELSASAHAPSHGPYPPTPGGAHQRHPSSGGRPRTMDPPVPPPPSSANPMHMQMQMPQPPQPTPQSIPIPETPRHQPMGPPGTPGMPRTPGMNGVALAPPPSPAA